MKITELTNDVSGVVKMKKGESTVNGNKAAGAVFSSGYNRDNPPVDDCCPICFGTFHFPSRTSCGHWFCSNCILGYWQLRYSDYLKGGKCPVCTSFMTKLIPHYPSLIPPEEQVHEILQEVQLYNQLNSGGCFPLIQKAVAVPKLIRRRFRQNFDEKLLNNIGRVMTFTGLLRAFLYDKCGFNFMPHGKLMIVVLMETFSLALILFLALDGIWYRWRLRRQHMRRLA